MPRGSTTVDGVTIYAIRRRVVCYVTRSAGAGLELLVLGHAGDEPAGTQVPAGDMLPFESVDAAALREVREQCGLVDLIFKHQLGAVELGLQEPEGPSLTTYAALGGPVDGPQAWPHEVSGDGPDAGMTFYCRWELLPLGHELARGQGVYLDRLSG
jgi:8-oxo-dGTP pyrophosphatase MutT (NUDIX family)